MTNLEKELELMKLELEISRVSTAKQDMLFRIKEREVDIQRLKDNIIIQDKRVEEVKNLIKKLKEGE